MLLPTTGEFLATAHENQRGISLWANRAAFERVDVGVAPRRPFVMDLAEGPLDHDDHDDHDDHADNDDDDDADVEALFPGFGDADNEGGGGRAAEDRTPKARGALTLSGLPPARWVGRWSSSCRSHGSYCVVVERPDLYMRHTTVISTGHAAAARRDQGAQQAAPASDNTCAGFTHASAPRVLEGGREWEEEGGGAVVGHISAPVAAPPRQAC